MGRRGGQRCRGGGLSLRPLPGAGISSSNITAPDGAGRASKSPAPTMFIEAHGAPQAAWWNWHRMFLRRPEAGQPGRT
jgi:hypothetical protein